jgi:glutamate---cysteine ligase / carboxylate-amine ligase
MTRRRLGLFEGYGVEIEYMIVRADDLSVFPASDRILRHFSGGSDSEIESGPLLWSNELVLHVLELKTGGPAGALEPLPGLFQSDVDQINAYLKTVGGRLLPTAMHPWMDPKTETRLWPHEYNDVYNAYDRIFGCSGHGWANLQSMHLNLPFRDDAEFGRLHAAIRLILPILPALAASSPVVEGRSTGIFDNRLEYYRRNQSKVPSLTGDVIPEPLYTESEYREKLLTALVRDLAPHDPDGCLTGEWINSRGAIARFERNTVEIRLIDVQECPLADCAIAACAAALCRFLASETTATIETQKRFRTSALAAILDSTIRDADAARIEDSEYVGLFGLNDARVSTAGDLWRAWTDRYAGGFLDSAWTAPVSVLLERGPLARRILNALGGDGSRSRLAAVYGELAGCLADGRLFLA